jgi:hypothetical protein
MCVPFGVPGGEARIRTAWLERNRTIRSAAWRMIDPPTHQLLADFASGCSNIDLVQYYCPFCPGRSSLFDGVR